MPLTPNATRYTRFYATEQDRTVLGRVDGLLLCEHATQGGGGCVIVVDAARRLAAPSGFYECDDMQEVHGDYRPSFDADGNLLIGGSKV